jgi:hypothetical protein
MKYIYLLQASTFAITINQMSDPITNSAQYYQPKPAMLIDTSLPRLEPYKSSYIAQQDTSEYE